MKTPLVLQYSDDWFVPGSPSDSRLFHADDADQIEVCPSQLGQGYCQAIPLQDDLAILIHDYTLNQYRVVDSPGESNCLEFEFRLAGRDAGYSSFIPYFGLKNFGIKPARKQYFNVEIWFKQPALITYFQALMERLSPQTRGTAERIMQWIARCQGGSSSSTLMGMLNQISGRAKAPGSQPTLEQILTDTLYAEAIAVNDIARSPITPAMQQVIGQILSCPYQGATRRTYLECQALSLVELYLEAIVHRRRHEADLNYIYQASTILRNQITNPPTIAALARQVGTNRLTLTQGFHKLYGTTPFGYLRNYRLEQARRLLMTSDLSVTEIAAAVGYASRNRFATAFRQRTGLNPKAFQMQVWQQAS
ncbi:helix-turn-helix transcriptional regulator [Vacuolonema iberomarrocanum]|uniref:helix-turn-helix transcriptional regulator n=1 Tax=Vacuolonema iberomarrocanum TaxID=3454632 RepID=UPI0019F31570|nr:helix-turn-helix transcriptional regulator [filamentous cyanobacterium LEGE 07170]